MAGQLDLFGAARAEGGERPASEGRSARPELAPASPDPRALSTILASEPQKQNPSGEGFDRAAEAAAGGETDSTTPPELAQALAAIVELIAEPDRWCQGCAARDDLGKPAIPAASLRLSAYGAFALLRFEGRITDDAARRLWFELDARTPRKLGQRQPFARWHDLETTTHGQVLALLKGRGVLP
jgi:hypothetical protein